MCKIICDNKHCNEFKTRNWKKMHNICKKSIPKNKYNEKLLLFNFDSKYISKRSKKKKSKNLFKNKLDIITLMQLNDKLQLNDKPEIYRIYKRYGYMPKTFKRKLKRKLQRCVFYSR